MTRLAIGYLPDADNGTEKPAAAFLENGGGVLLYVRSEHAPRRIDTVVADVAPDDPRYFDAVIDMFADTFLIRWVHDLEPEFIATMLAHDQVWDALPRSFAAA